MKPKPEFGYRKCLDITGEAMCEQEGCNEPAVCITRVAGFIVYACKQHHYCSKGKERETEAYMKKIKPKKPPEFDTVKRRRQELQENGEYLPTDKTIRKRRMIAAIPQSEIRASA